MTQQLDMLGILVDEPAARRLDLPQQREVRRPRLPSIARPENPPAKTFATVDVPRAANADPESSHLAAASIKASGALNEQQQLARDWVHRFPGRTSAELAREYAKVHGGTWRDHRPMFGRRLSEIACDVFHVKRGDMRTCEVVGRECVTWWPKENNHA